MDEIEKKEALRLFTYGLYAVTVGEASDWNAFTANWVSQVSFDPPLLALSVENTSTSLPMIMRERRFTVHVFGADQRELAGTLGKPRVLHPDKLLGLPVEFPRDVGPILTNTLAWVSCAIESETPAGDSTILVGRVNGAGVLRRDEPLTMKVAGFRHAG